MIRSAWPCWRRDSASDGRVQPAGPDPRAPRRGALVIFEVPGRSRAIGPEGEDVRACAGSSGCPQPPESTEGTALSSATHLRTRIMAVGGAVLLLLVAGIWAALATTRAGA